MKSNPPIFLVGEAYGEAEAKLKAGFVGPSGAFLLRLLNDSRVITLTKDDRYLLNQSWNTSDPKYIDQVWQGHPELYRTNVFNLHPPSNELSHFCGPIDQAIGGYPPLLKGTQGYVRAEFEPELERLADEILTLNPNLLVCLGGSPLWALTGRTGIKTWRGPTCVSTHTATGYKLLPTYHPAYVVRDYQSRPIVIADLQRASREAQFPEIRRTEREIWIEPTLDDIRAWIAQHIQRTSPLSVDIETSGTRITCIGLGYSNACIVIPFDDERRPGRSYWPTQQDERACWDLIRGVLSNGTIPKVFQNGLYDIAFLWRSVRVKVLGAAEDTMLAHHALQPEMEKGLGFLGSIYSDERSWKHMGKRHRKTIKRDA